MNAFLKNYSMKIHTLAPVFIGDGSKIGKKEYIYLPWEHRIIIPDLGKMYEALSKAGKRNAYEKYMLENSREDLSVWLKQQGISKREYDQWKQYEIDAGEIPLTGDQFRSVKAKEIASFIKDAYGLPYVPGSSIKGMFRTALLAYEIRHNPEKYRGVVANIKENVRKTAGRTVFLSRETEEMESTAFHKYYTDVAREETRLKDAVNDSLAGLRVSDSEPVPLKSLALSQKIDLFLDGREKPLPILRETLSPETDIFFEVTIDSSMCPYGIEDILNALSEFQSICYDSFYSRFRRGSRDKDVVWLGGGTGFLSKTVLYPLFGKDAVRVTDQVLRNTLGKKYVEHKHNKDLSLGIAPHVCKCTRYGGTLHDMGMARIEWLR